MTEPFPLHFIEAEAFDLGVYLGDFAVRKRPAERRGVLGRLLRVAAAGQSGRDKRLLRAPVKRYLRNGRIEQLDIAPQATGRIRLDLCPISAADNAEWLLNVRFILKEKEGFLPVS